MSRQDRKQDKKIRFDNITIKKTNFLYVFFIVALCIFVGYLCYAKLINDTKPPVVKCDSDMITVSVTASETELLKGVTAYDERSGDVTDSLIIENISAAAGGEHIIVYAAFDEKGNVGRCQRVLKYSDYEPPEITLTDYLVFPVGSQINFLDYVTAYSTLDGDLTSKIKYSISRNVDYSASGVYEVEFRVSDSAGTVSYLTAELEIYEPY